MPGRFLIYGATGYTGELLARRACRTGGEGERPLLAGRSPHRLAPLAEALGCEWRTAGLDAAGGLDAILRDVDVVLNAAGPFGETSRPLVDACLRTRTHYLDVAGELAVFPAVHARDAEARAAGVMLMPGVGFAIAASDCLLAHLAGRLPGARSLALGISRPTLWSRGSLRTLIDLWSDHVEIRRDGAIRSVEAGSLTRDFDYGAGPRTSTAMPWPDVFTAHHTAGLRDVEVYGEVDTADRMLMQWTLWWGRVVDTTPWRRWLKLQADLFLDGPSERLRDTHSRVLVAELCDAAGRRVRSRLRTPEPYSFSLVTALAVVDRVLRGELAPGYRTPGRVYGPGLVLDRPGVVLEDGLEQSAPGRR